MLSLNLNNESMNCQCQLFVSLFVSCCFRVTFGVHPDTHLDEIQKAEQVMLDGSWSAKIAITGMYLLNFPNARFDLFTK